MNSDLCPACGEYQLPKIPEGSRITARKCQNDKCGRVFEVKRDLKPDLKAALKVRPDLDELK